MRHALTPGAVEALLGPAAGILEGLVASATCEDTRRCMHLCLDVLAHAARAQGAALITLDGAVIASAGLKSDTVEALSASARGPLPRCLEEAQIVHGGGMVAFTSLGLPLAGGALLMLATTEGARHEIDTTAMLAILPGVLCVMQTPPVVVATPTPARIPAPAG